jgi:hypothetical protein
LLKLSETFLRSHLTRHQWLIPVILATQEAEIKGLQFKFSQKKIPCRPYLKNIQYKKDWQTDTGVKQLPRIPENEFKLQSITKQTKQRSYLFCAWQEKEFLEDITEITRTTVIPLST